MPRVDKRLDLQQLVDEFANTIGYDQTLNHHKLVVSNPCYPYEQCRETYPNSDEPGCYVWTSGAGTTLYVGKASRYLGNRMWAHTGRNRKFGETEIYPTAVQWAKDNQPDLAVWAIAVPDTHWWLALALEGFLTEKLLPHQPRP